MRPLLIILAVLLAGCGPLERDELKRGVESLRSITAEGRLLADGTATDRSRSTYTRAQARTLSEDVQHEAEKLADATPASGLIAERDRAVAIAGDLGGALGDLQTQPGEESVGQSVRDDLQQIQDSLDDLDRELK